MRYLFCFLGILFLQIQLSAQPCGTVVTQQHQDFLTRFAQPAMYSFRSGNNQPKTVRKFPVQLHIVRQSNGQGGVTVSEVDAALSLLNQKYAPAKVKLIRNKKVNYISSNRFYHFRKSDENLMCNEHDVKNVINLYVVNSIKLGNSNGIVAGYAYMPNGPDRMVMNATYLGDKTTLIHEAGHYFGLPHTHGMGNMTITNELVDGSNCNSEGDKICDTPADPNLLGVVDYQCNYVGNYRDKRGRTYQPMVENYMSYAPAHCCSKFTKGQYDIISYTAHHSRKYLKPVTIDNTPSQPGNPTPETELLTAKDYFDQAMKATRNSEKIRNYNKAIELDPNFPEAWNNRAWVKYEITKYQSALRDANKAIQLKRHANFHHTRGAIYHALKQYKNAIEDYNMALSIDPDFVDARNDKKISEQALANSQQTEELSEDEYFNLALNSESLEDQIFYYSKILDKNPSHASAWNNRAWAKHQLGQNYDALNDVNKALELVQDKDFLHTKGNIHHALGNYNKAIAAYDAALALDPTYSYAKKDRAKSVRAMGTQPEPTTPQPDNPVVVNNEPETPAPPPPKAEPVDKKALASKYFREARAARNPSKKATLYTKVLRINPRHHAAWNNRAMAKMDLKQYRAALSDATKAVQLKRHKSYYHTKGLAYYNLKQYKKAILEFDKALRIDPKFHWAKQDKKRSQIAIRKQNKSIIYTRNVSGKK